MIRHELRSGVLAAIDAAAGDTVVAGRLVELVSGRREIVRGAESIRPMREAVGGRCRRCCRRHCRCGGVLRGFVRHIAEIDFQVTGGRLAGERVVDVRVGQMDVLDRLRPGTTDSKWRLMDYISTI